LNIRLAIAHWLYACSAGNRVADDT
jgi:hypothetical protein